MSPKSRPLPASRIVGLADPAAGHIDRLSGT